MTEDSRDTGHGVGTPPFRDAALQLLDAKHGDAIDGLNGSWFAGLLAAAGLFAGLAWWCFERRDIRVVGEGGWRWPLRRGKTSA